MKNQLQHQFEKLEIPILNDLNKLYEFSHTVIGKFFPKFERYTLGEKIERTILEAIELTITANNSTKYQREMHLLSAQSKAELLKILWRMALQIEAVPEIKYYLQAESHLQSVSKQLSGWIKFTRTQ